MNLRTILFSKTAAILLSTMLLCIMSCSSNVRINTKNKSSLTSYIDRIYIVSFVHSYNHRFGSALDDNLIRQLNSNRVKAEALPVFNRDTSSVDKLPQYKRDKIFDFNPVAIMEVRLSKGGITKNKVFIEADFGINLIELNPNKTVWQATVESDSIKGVFTNEIAEIVALKTVDQLKKDGFLPN